MTFVLGVSAYYHDSAAALIADGTIVAAAEEERFSRHKHDSRFPSRAIRYCLDAAGIELDALDAVVFYDKPFLKFERLLETYLAQAPRGFRSFRVAMPIWLKEKLFQRSLLERELRALAAPELRLPPLLFSEHHLSHAASAFYPSPYAEAAILCLDGVGEWTTSSAWIGQGSTIAPLWEQPFPHSLGLLYSAFTAYTGFRVNSGEYKMMGLAPYGEPRYAALIRDHLIDVKPDGSFRLDMSYFEFTTGLRMTSERFHALFDAPPREPGAPIDQHTVDVASSVQQVTEEVVLALAHNLHAETDMPALCLAGGVALNCVANGRLVRSGPFGRIWIQPAAGDAGGALGAALYAWHLHFERPRNPQADDAMCGSLLGPDVSDADAERFLQSQDIAYRRLGDAALVERVAELIASGHVVGWVQGRMEFGPRALGARSILADPRDPGMQRKLNLRVKFRESFRPFAPSVVEERAADLFTLDRPSPYMLLVAAVQGAVAVDAAGAEPLERLNLPRSGLPAITHVDGSARIQTVAKHVHPRYHALLEAFAQRTGVPVLINTSFNVRGEPIVCTAEDAVRCFARTQIDHLVLGCCLVERSDLPPRYRAVPAPAFAADQGLLGARQ
jgi:carbamoyltransferase